MDFLPQDHKPQYIDDKWWNGDITVFFQMAEEKNNSECNIIEKVIWAIDDQEENVAKFKRFLTSYYPGNKQEFREYIVKRKL